MIKASSLFTIFLFAWFGASQSSIAAPQPKSIDTDYPLTKITNKVYAIFGPISLPTKENRGFRNNPGIVLTEKGVVVIDPGGSAYGGELVIQKIKTITKKPVIAVFNTHAHGDHWLGNEGIKKAYPNAIIYSHPKMKTKIDGPDGKRWLDLINKLTENTAAGTRAVSADKTVNHGDVIKLGNMQFRIYHKGNAHTDNDIMIEVVNEKVLFTGDIVRSQMLGAMEEGSSFKGNTATIDMILQSDAKHYVAGHGPAGNAEMVKLYRNYLDTLYKSVKKYFNQDLADFEMKPKVVEALSAYKKWWGFEVRVGSHISRAYLEIESEEF